MWSNSTTLSIRVTPLHLILPEQPDGVVGWFSLFRRKELWVKKDLSINFLVLYSKSGVKINEEKHAIFENTIQTKT